MVKMIPFCAARSTGPSYNVGINIQQMMSSMKFQRCTKRQYPALTYNMRSSIVTFDGAPLSRLTSAINARARHIKRQRKRQYHIGFKMPRITADMNSTNEVTPQCNHESQLGSSVNEHSEPHLNRNLQFLYRSVRHIRQESPMEQDSVDQLGGSSIDVRHIDSGVNLSRCKKRICIPKSELEVLFASQEFENFDMMSESEVSIVQWIKNGDNKLKEGKEKLLKHTNYEGDNLYQQLRGDSILQGKENKLKEVLMQLHNDFEKLTKIHSELSHKMQNKEMMAGGDNEGMSKTLCDVEKELSKKEDQIIMFITLCNEVISLKQRIKYLDCVEQNYIENPKCGQSSSAFVTLSRCSSFNEYCKSNR
ncbi:uncharacterized protein LOC130893422 [Diorhabda carinulata]|uniref:uncharacterized protein LOC130893422 n=1 Tax=Diorhabda carinulata TaxID=1163345 RepID=UPI0025A0474A|nr:uncharacterized protein LOC130893422 [Diorhabda carinulata]